MADTIKLVAKTGSPTINGNTVTVSREQVVTTDKYVNTGTGVWYWEATVSNLDSAYGYIGLGVASSTYTVYASKSSVFMWNNTSTNVVSIMESGTVRSTIQNAHALHDGDTVGIILDTDNSTIQYVFKEFISEKYTVGSLTDFSPLCVITNATVSATCTFNFGESEFLLYSQVADTILDYDSVIRTYVGNKISIDKVLFKSKNKYYSIKSPKNNGLYKLAMTSNTLPSPYVVSASSFYYTYQPWKAFDGKHNQQGDSWFVNSKGWIQIDYGKKVRTNKVVIYSGNYNTSSSPRDFQILGSYDGVNFEEISYLLGETEWVAGVAKTFYFKPCSYRYYRINVLNNNGHASYVTIDEIIFGDDSVQLLEIPEVTLKTFSDYGEKSVKPIYNFNRPLYGKNYVLQDPVDKDIDGLLVKALDKKPLSINFKKGD